jgi:phosphate transport system substrate-binding protein
MGTKRHLGIGAVALGAAALAASGCGGGKTSQSHAIVGAGSTLVAPLVSQWSSEYAKRQSVTVTYGAIGSGGGIAQTIGGNVDFGASDAPLSPDQLHSGEGIVQIPWALAATLVAVNLPGVRGHPKLTGPVLASIYLGKVKRWNDAAIRKLNPGLHLPSTKIAVVYRSDSSGDTYAFSDYLAHVSPTWRSKVGTDTSVSWPTGSGARGNAGMVAAVQQTPGAIAYIAIANVLGSHLDYALLRNAAGTYPVPSPPTIAAAARIARFKPDHSASIVDPPASDANAYPISTFTYVLVPKGSAKLATLKPFLRYAVGPGQKFALPLSFAPLPSDVMRSDLEVISGL